MQLSPVMVADKLLAIASVILYNSEGQECDIQVQIERELIPP
jgi:hypothetical protein